MPNTHLREAFRTLMARAGKPIQRITSTTERRGPTPEVYRLNDGRTVRLRTNARQALMAKTATGDVSADLPWEEEDFVGVAFPGERPNSVRGYLIPSTVVSRDVRDAHSQWLASGGSIENRTRVIHFDGDPAKLGWGYAHRYSEYSLGEIDLAARHEASELAQEIAESKRRIAAKAGTPESAVKISIEY
jgi:hypothetical protein